MVPTLSYCARQVRWFDRERYLSALFVPAPSRERVFALYACNLEIAKTRESVSEPLIGQMRLTWWFEAIDELYAGRVRRHPVVEALAAGGARERLDRALFERLLGGREFDLEDEPPATLAEL